MNKKEVYYKFMFTNYDSLSGTDNNWRPTSDGVDQIGEVRALLNACPDHVITYDQLTGSRQTDSSVWTSAHRDEIRSYVDQWTRLPKYFSLRNYWDTYTCQEGGMSLMVSHSPEIGATSTPWTKFISSSNNKVIYCSLMVSSGDFFYEWNLPDEVLIKSNLRDKVVYTQFHKNWYLNLEERTYCASNGLGNKEIGNEKIVFVPHYFNENLNYLPRGGIKFFVNYTDSNNNVYQHSEVYYVDKDGNDTESIFIPPFDGAGHFYTISGSTKTNGHRSGGIPVTRHRYESEYSSSQYYVIYNNSKVAVSQTTVDGVAYYTNSTGTVKVSARYVPEKYTDLSEDLKKDFVDLEVTRRILFYNNPNYQNLQNVSSIPTIVSGIGKNTKLSYEPPQEYIYRPPLQIPYNLLRYSLNDRPPFTDCETVLVMWVADSDPASVTDGDVEALHNLNWQQYAIPMSIRCCFKDYIDNSRYCHDRFLVTYPYSNPLSHTSYRFHTRRCEAYDKNTFREVLYLKDLIDYSQDYIISYQNKSNYNVGFDIQRYLFEKLPSDAFKELYIKKYYTSVSYNQQQQIYYIKVDKTDVSSHKVYAINTVNDSLPVCFVKPDASGNATNTLFVPSEVLTRDKYEKWNFDDIFYTDIASNDWAISDYWFIALFDANCKINNQRVFGEVSGILTLTNADALKNRLHSANSSYTWDDIYISSLGISPTNQTNNGSIISGARGGTYIPLGALDNHIQIDGVTYGSSTNSKIIAGFKKLFDYTYEDYCHFKYNALEHTYESVSETFNYNSGNHVSVSVDNNCTAYIINLQV